MAARSDEEAKAITASQPVIPIELHVVGKNRYGPLTGAEPILLDFDQGHGGFREQRFRPLVPAGNGSGPNPRRCASRGASTSRHRTASRRCH